MMNSRAFPDSSQIPLPDKSSLREVLEYRSRDPHAVLGMHRVKDGIVVCVFDPCALEIAVIVRRRRYSAVKVDERGLFACYFKRRKNMFAYLVEKKFEHSTYCSADPYCYLPSVSEDDIYLFNQGNHQNIYRVMGAHVKQYGEVSGTAFAVWAPNAKRVSVVGNFNQWDGRRHAMRMLGVSGIWEIFIPGIGEGEVYKYEVLNCDDQIVLKTDPYARRMEKRPNNASIVCSDAPFSWNDGKWMEKRQAENPLEKPMNIYEVHLGTWGGPGLTVPTDKEEFNSYRELAVALADYVRKMGFTHVELLPVTEHPLDISWGYQVTGFYAPTSRYGSPEDFAFFVDYMHRNGIGVILDWVPAHFPKDSFALGRFDGTALYEHRDPRQGEQKGWGTYVFNLGRYEVRNFLSGSALFWMDVYHADGLRVDAVASILYRNYLKEDGDWVPNEYGGCENLEAISFFRQLNQWTHSLHPGTFMIAEESTSFPKVSRPVYDGGLGFTFKWNMGWMHDTLDYFKLDPLYRKFHHNKLTFSICYAFSENFVLPFSHDEVVHGKLSLFGRMSGDYKQKFANLRAMYLYDLTHPGKKLLFMGGEFAQVIEWNCNLKCLDWLLLKYPAHDAFHRMVAEANHLYLNEPALWENDFQPAGFQWIDADNAEQSVYSYIRWDKQGKRPLLVVLNLTPVVREHFVLGVPRGGEWVEIFNTDRHEYDGTGLLNGQKIIAEQGVCHNQPYHVEVRLPWLSAIILAPKPNPNPATAEDPPEPNARELN